MMVLKNILVMMILLSVMLPCGHAAEVHDITDDGLGTDLCDCVKNSGECHADNHRPCSNKQIQFESRTAVKLINAAPAFLVGAKALPPENERPIKNHNPMVYGVLSSILTVQLLI
jgi:hypothetical protein